MQPLEAPREVVWIGRTLEAAGFETWAVGGAVRDALLGLRPQDWDLATAARPADVRRLFRRTVPIGIEHGTVGVLARSGRMYEVTTFRRDVETFGRKARVVFSDTIEEDLQRRDFTINAVAWHPVRRELRDPHGGAEDLRRGVLRTVGEPAERFAEDWLRVLRALRFAGRFSLRIEAATWAAISGSTDRLDGLSAERVREELMKVLAAGTPSAALALYAESGVLGALYPELSACIGQVAPGPEPDRWTWLLRVCDAVRPHRPLVRLAALLHTIGAPGAAAPGQPGESAATAREVLRRLKCSNREVDLVTHLVAHQADVPSADAPAAELRRWMRRVGAAHVRDLLRLRSAQIRAGGARPSEVRALRRLRDALARLAADAPALGVEDLAIGGAELGALGIPRGPLYGEILRDLLERVTDDPSLNRRETLLGLVRRGIDQAG
jgi:tRNA nucleotidyltransferase (CCA-adding enzyme)